MIKKYTTFLSNFNDEIGKNYLGACLIAKNVERAKNSTKPWPQIQESSHIHQVEELKRAAKGKKSKFVQ